MTCKTCGREIKDSDVKYRSVQRGLEGDYHWSCFIKVCREVNRIGSQILENNIQSTGNLHVNTPIEMF
jgi:hypothetical protein